MPKTQVEFLYETNVPIAITSSSLHDDLDDGPCSDIAEGPGVFKVSVLTADDENGAFALVSLMAPGENDDEFISCDVMTHSVKELRQMRDALSAAIDAMEMK